MLKNKKPTLNEDFLSFEIVDETQFTKKKDEGKDLEALISKKFDKSKYPWLTKRTMKIKDIFLFLHSEILDFVEFVKQSQEDKK